MHSAGSERVPGAHAQCTESFSHCQPGQGRSRQRTSWGADVGTGSKKASVCHARAIPGTGPPALKLWRSENDGHPVQLNLGGELDAFTVDELADWMTTLRLDGERHGVLNLSELTFCDARGQAAILAMRETLLQQGRHLTLRNVRR